MDDTLGTPLPDLTRLVMHVTTNHNGTRVLKVSFLVNTQQLLLEDFEGACVDAALRHAHHAGHLPVGPMLVTTEAAESEQLGRTCELCDGKGWLFDRDEQDCPDCEDGKVKAKQGGFRSIDDLQIENSIMSGDLVQAHCQVELGLSL